MTELADKISEYATSLDYAQINKKAIFMTKLDIIDTLATLVAGSSAEGIEEVLEIIKDWGGKAEADIFVHGIKVPSLFAALANGIMAHARDFDDTHDEATLHAGTSVVPAAIAAAQAVGNVSGKEFLTAVNIGLDVLCRLGKSCTTGITESGWMYTSLMGYFGATVAAGRIYKLSKSEMHNALGIVYSQVAGNHQVTRDAALTKRMQPGFAAKAALFSVKLAKKGIKGVQNVFEGEDGFFRVYLQNNIIPEMIVKDLGESFETERLSFKPYPCCRHNHAAIDAALELRSKHSINASDIESIEVYVTKQGYEAVCTPVHVRKDPHTAVEAQFSIPYTVSVALLTGKVGLSDMTQEAIRRENILELASKVEAIVDSKFDELFGRNITPARVVIKTKDNETYQAEVDIAKGHFLRPFTTMDIQMKIQDCFNFSKRPLNSNSSNLLYEGVMNLENETEVDRLFSRILNPEF
jgi:2-methylcitrate dehydratase PrpD